MRKCCNQLEVAATIAGRILFLLCICLHGEGESVGLCAISGAALRAFVSLEEDKRAYASP